MTTPFCIPAILKLPKSLSHQQLANNVRLLKESGRLGKVPSHLITAISQIPILTPCHFDQSFRYYSADAWYELACQLPYASGEFSIASKRAFYNHISTLKSTGLLLVDAHPDQDCLDEISLNAKISPTQFLRICPPNLEMLEPKVAKKKKLSTSNQHPSCMLIDDQSLTHGGSLHITARLLNHVVNISSKPCFENIEGEVSVKDAQTQQEGTVFLRTSSPRHLPVMDVSHVVLVNVIYKLIIYRMAMMFADGKLTSSS